MYRVYFRKRALKSLTKKISSADRKTILKKIEILAKNPYNQALNVKKLVFFKNLEKAYRLRIGNLRIIYELESKTKKIIIYLIDYRRTTTY